MRKIGFIWVILIVLTWGGTQVCIYLTEKEQKQVSAEAQTVAGEKRIGVRRNDINSYMDLEDYVAGVIACQMREGMAGEALKCQAVIARTYICRLMDGRDEISEEELDLEYLEDTWGKGREKDSAAIVERLDECTQATQDTRGAVMKYEDKCILPLFHAISGGRTRADAGEFPYIQSVESAWDREAENYETCSSWTMEEFAALINQMPEAAQITAGELPQEIQTVKRDDAGYVEEMKIGAKTYAGESVQYALGLSAACFTITGEDGLIKAFVRGKGHGYGLSQAGAMALSDQGWGYEDILKYYFKNISLVTE